MPISIKKDLQKEIRGICTYHGDEGTNGYSLSEEQFEKLFELYDQAISLTLQRVREEIEEYNDGLKKEYGFKNTLLDDLINKLK